MFGATKTTVRGPGAVNNWSVSLDLAGLIALADLSSILKRCALTGTSSIFDALVISPGLHRQNKAGDFGTNQGELPEAASLDSGHVFHIHNPATVMFFQDMSETGHLTVFEVEELETPKAEWQESLVRIFDYREESKTAMSFYFLAVVMTLLVIIATAIYEDWYAFWGTLALVLARALNVHVMRRRAHSPGAEGWFGNRQEGGQGDIFVLLSRDRWVRLRGKLQDIKLVTAGNWLDKPRAHESALISFATLIVFADTVMINNAQNVGKLLIVMLLLVSAIMLALVNERTKQLKMHGRVIRQTDQIPFEFRLDMIKALNREVGFEWAENLRMMADGDKKKIR